MNRLLLFHRIRRFRDDRILMLITRRAATQEPQDLCTGIPYFVTVAGMHPNGIAHDHIPILAVHTDPSLSVGDIIDFFRFWMIMLLGGLAGIKTCLCQTLIAYPGIAIGQNFPDLRCIFGHKSRNFIQIFNIHTTPIITQTLL